MTDKKPAAKKAEAPKDEKAEAPKDETPKDDPGTPSTEVLQEQKVPADEAVAPAAVTNVIHGKEYEVTPDRGYRLK